VLAAPLVTTAVLAGSRPGAVSASAGRLWTEVQPPSPGSASNILDAAAAVSPRQAWAVGW
jgi:hypothetical protein